MGNVWWSNERTPLSFFHQPTYFFRSAALVLSLRCSIAPSMISPFFFWDCRWRTVRKCPFHNNISLKLSLETVCVCDGIILFFLHSLTVSSLYDLSLDGQVDVHREIGRDVRNFFPRSCWFCRKLKLGRRSEKEAPEKYLSEIGMVCD